jgi:hypothetical protein
MRSNFTQIVVFFLVILTIVSHAETKVKQILSAKNVGSRRCEKPKNGQHICFCGKNKVTFDRLKGERCINGKVVQTGNQKRYASLRN